VVIEPVCHFWGGCRRSWAAGGNVCRGAEGDCAHLATIRCSPHFARRTRGPISRSGGMGEALPRRWLSWSRFAELPCFASERAAL